MTGQGTCSAPQDAAGKPGIGMPLVLFLVWIVSVSHVYTL
jgi:hypothetical protein